MQPFGNRSTEDGFTPNTRTGRFAYWSGLRSFLLRRVPWHIALIVLTSALAKSNPLLGTLVIYPRRRRGIRTSVLKEGLAVPHRQFQIGKGPTRLCTIVVQW